MPEFFNVEFQGRASRAVFWKNQLACLLCVVASLALLLTAMVAQAGFVTVVAALLFTLTTVYAVVSAYAIGARRCRDLGHSGWMVLVYLVPLAGLPFALYLGLAQPKPTPTSA